ncbi:MAG TPA: 4Fe-4S binding protein [Candidatus Deferrimicrobium sp.]|nr:4Fe-4S binding protein [Candidatus Deferrimicrobium sp.]
MARPLWFVELIKKGFPRRFLIAKLTKIPILGKVFEKLLDKLIFQGSEIIYLPKDQIIQVDRAITGSKEVVLPSQVVDYFIERAKYHWIMNFCICRASEKCKNYPIALGCLFLGEAVLGINPQLGRLVTKEEALEHVKRCREAGLVHMIGRDKIDASWLNIGPEEKLLTICNCCNCCCLWRILPHLPPKLRNTVNRMPGIKVLVMDRCIGCGTCSDICFVEAIQVINKKAVIGEGCRGCGRCASICPQNAIHIVIEDAQFVEKSINKLQSLVDIF